MLQGHGADSRGRQIVGCRFVFDDRKDTQRTRVNVASTYAKMRLESFVTAVFMERCCLQFSHVQAMREEKGHRCNQCVPKLEVQLLLFLAGVG